MANQFNYDDIFDGDAAHAITTLTDAITHSVRVARNKKGDPGDRRDAWHAVASLTAALRSAGALRPPLDCIDVDIY